MGVPFNIASYALLTAMVAQVSGYRAGELVLTLGDAHLYLNHRDQAELQLGREPYAPPTLRLDSGVERIDDFSYDNIEIVGYRSHPRISAPIAV